MAEPVRIVGGGTNEGRTAQVDLDDILFAKKPGQAIRVNIDSGDTNITYVGKALIGSATSAALWQVIEIDETTGTVITWADSDQLFNNIYDDRESLNYG